MLLSYTKRFIHLIFGLFLYALGACMGIQAGVGLAPWEAFHIGISYISALSVGTVVVVTGLFIIVIDLLMKEKVGFGTILNATLIGVFMDIILSTKLLPTVENFALGVGLLLLGQVVISFASFFYIGAAMGCGPRDALMVFLCRKFPKASVGLIRSCLEGVVLFFGWLCGAKVGVGTLLAVFGIGIIMQNIFRILKFDVKAIKHEDLLDTLTIWRGKSQEKSNNKSQVS